MNQNQSQNQNRFSGEDSQSPPFNGWIKKELEDSEEEVEEEEEEMYFKQQPEDVSGSRYDNLMNLTKEELVTKVLQQEEDIQYLQDIRNGLQNTVQELSSTCAQMKNVMADMVSAISAIRGNKEKESTANLSNTESTMNLLTKDSTTGQSTKEPTANFVTKESVAGISSQQLNASLSTQQSNTSLSVQQSNTSFSAQQSNTSLSVKESTANRLKPSTSVATPTVSTPSVATSNVVAKAMSTQLTNETLNKTNKSITESMIDNGSILRSKLNSKSITLTEIPMSSHSKSNAGKSHSPVLYPPQPSPSVHPQHSSPSVHPQHSSPSVHPQHSSPNVHLQHPSPNVHPQHSTPNVHPQHSSANVHPQQPSPVVQQQHPSPVVPSQQSSSVSHPQHPSLVARPQHPSTLTRPQQPPSITRPQQPSSNTRPQHSSVARLQNPSSIANSQQPSPVASPQHPMSGSRSQHPSPLANPQNPSVARPRQPSPVLLPPLPKLPAGLTISVSKNPPLKADDSQVAKISPAILIPRTMPPGNVNNSPRNTVAPSGNGNNIHRTNFMPSRNANNSHRNIPAPSGNNLRSTVASSSNSNTIHRSTVASSVRMKQKTFADDQTNYVPEKRMRNMTKPSVSFITKQLSIKIKSEPVDEDSSEEDVKVLMPEEWLLALNNSTCTSTTLQSVSEVSKTSFFKEITDSRVSQKLTRNLAVDTSANCSISEWTDQIMGHDESGLMPVQDQQQNASYEMFGQDSMSQPFLTEDFGEYDSDDLDHKVYLSDDVSLPRELMDACLKQGPTPSKLARNLMQSLFPDLRELATSCVVGGQMTNLAKQSRPALPENKVNAIISMVQRQFPSSKKSAIIMAMNMKCKEARKMFTRAGQSRMEMDESFD